MAYPRHSIPGEESATQTSIPFSQKLAAHLEVRGLKEIPAKLRYLTSVYQ
jgi:hypothetical protein